MRGEGINDPLPLPHTHTHTHTLVVYGKLSPNIYHFAGNNATMFQLLCYGLNPFLPKAFMWHHETFSFIMSLLAMSFGAEGVEQ